MAELESVLEKRLIDQLCLDESQWTYQQDIRTEKQLWENGRVYVHVQRGNETLHLVVMNHEHIAGGTSVYEVVNQFQAFKGELTFADTETKDAVEEFISVLREV